MPITRQHHMQPKLKEGKEPRFFAFLENDIYFVSLRWCGLLHNYVFLVLVVLRLMELIRKAEFLVENAPHPFQKPQVSLHSMHIHSELHVARCLFFAARIAPWAITSSFNKSLVWSTLVSSPLPPLALALCVHSPHSRFSTQATIRTQQLWCLAWKIETLFDLFEI